MVCQQNLADSSRFMSNREQLRVLQRANLERLRSGENVVKFTMEGVTGEGYLRGGNLSDYLITNKFKTIYRNDLPYTGYPDLRQFINEQQFAETVKRTARIGRHLGKHSCLRAGKNISRMFVGLNRRTDLFFRCRTALINDLLKFVEDQSDLYRIGLCRCQIF